MLIERAPARFENFFARCFKRNAIYLTLNGRGGKFAIGIEHADETHGNEVEDVLFALCQSRHRNSCWDDGVVIGHLAAVKHLFALRQLFADGRQLMNGCFVFGLAIYLRLAESIQYLRALGIDVLAEILCVDARIGGEFALVKRLNEVERVFCGIAKFAVAIHLQRGEVIQKRWRFGAFLFLYARDLHGLSFDGCESLLTLFAT